MKEQLPHLKKTGSACQLWVEGKPFILLSGEIHNSSASNLQYMDEHVWPALVETNCNSAIVPLYWELIEPEEGQFDFELIDGLIRGARRHGLRLVFLWFATWKNGESWYAPEWVKKDLTRFPRAQITPGINTETISCFSEEACQADARAFAAVMKHIRQCDAQEQTVLAVQVENEVGLLGGVRDRSGLAEQKYHAPVPQELVTYLITHADALLPEMSTLWRQSGPKKQGSWPEVFGSGAPEVFMAWHIARYVDRVAAAGKREYPLPMYVNTWLVQYEDQPPGEYPSGGPTHRLLNIWQAAAPHVDFIAPDIYLSCFKTVCAQYHRGGNPLMIPETRPSQISAANVFYALAEHDAICFAPFGIEDAPGRDKIAQAYAFLRPLLPLIAKYQGTGRMVGILDEDGSPHHFRFGDYLWTITFNQKSALAGLGFIDEESALPGRGLLIQLATDEFLLAGADLAAAVTSTNEQKPHAHFLSVEEGDYSGGQWQPRRRLNGDELPLRFSGRLQIRRVKLYLHS